jgi:hypothetical protein
MVTQEENQKELVEALLKRIEAAEAKAKNVEAENLKLKMAAKGQIAAMPVSGTFKAKVLVDGERVEKTFQFKDGKITVRSHRGVHVGVIYMSELVIKMANTGSISADELKQYPITKQLTQTAAKEMLQHLADCESALVQIVE